VVVASVRNQQIPADSHRADAHWISSSGSTTLGWNRSGSTMCSSTLGFARQSLTGIWESTAGGEFNPPLFYWLEHGMLFFGEQRIRCFGSSLHSLGVLTIPVMYLIGKEFRDQNVGIIAAALLTFLAFHILLLPGSPGIRPDALLLLSRAALVT